jgi:hypothetical protein
MIPDLPMFVPHLLSYENTHSVPGVFTACLPMGLATFFCFELFMKEPLVELLPRRMRQRIPRSSIQPTPLSMPMILWAIFAVILGAFTHLFWDSFTHPNRLGTQLVPPLNRSMNLQGTCCRRLCRFKGIGFHGSADEFHAVRRHPPRRRDLLPTRAGEHLRFGNSLHRLRLDHVDAPALRRLRNNFETKEQRVCEERMVLGNLKPVW